MTLEELHDNFAKYADIIHAATAAGAGAVYDGQPVVHDTVRDVFTVLTGPSVPRTWGAMELAAKNAIEGVLNAHNQVGSTIAATVEEAKKSDVVEAAPKTKAKNKK